MGLRLALGDRSKFGFILGAVLCASAAFSSVASAQEAPNAAETAAARTLAVEGLKLAQSGQCEQAIDKLTRAESLYHSAIVLSRLGECHISVGHLVEGSELLRKVLREPLPPNPSAALSQAYERAQMVLDAAKPRIAAVNVSIEAPAEATPTILVDGKPIPSAMVGADLPSDPGEHLIEVSAPGFLRSSTRVNLQPGEKQAVTLKLDRDPNAPESNGPSEPAEAAQPRKTLKRSETTSVSSLNEPSSAASPQSSPNRTPAYIAYGAAAVGLGVGAGFGLAALKARSDVDDRCPGGVCSSDTQSSIDSGKTKGTISTIGFGVAAAGAALGTVLLFTTGDDDVQREKASARRVHHARGLRAGASVGLGVVRLHGEF